MSCNTFLHDYAENFLFKPDDTKEFWKQVTAENVNSKNKGLATPYSWLLLGKVKWQDDSDKLDSLSQAEKKLIEMGADVHLASAGLVSPIVKWIFGYLDGKERKNLSEFIDTVKHFDSKWTDEQLYFLMGMFKESVPPSQLNFKKDILGILLARNKNKTSMLNEIICKLNIQVSIYVIEILSKAADDGQTLEFGNLDLQHWPKFLNTSTELTEHFLKIMSSTNISPDKCDLDFLGEFYQISEEIIKWGRKLVHRVYTTWKECLESKKLINCFLFIGDENDSLSEEFITESYKINWLGRNPVHLAVIFLDHLECLPDSIIKKNIREKDVHGCSPLHMASLHQKKRAEDFLLKHGFDENATDHFGLTHRDIGQGPDHEVLYDEQCRRIIEATDGTDQLMDHLKPLLVLPETEAERLTEQLQELFRRLVKETPFSDATIQIAGSLREKLKSGHLDEGDIQIRLPDHDKEKLNNNGLIFNLNPLRKDLWENDERIEKLPVDLIDGLGKISWKGINLRLVNVSGPWQLIWERDGPIKGMLLSLDVVLIKISDGEPCYYIHQLQEEMLDGAPTQNKMQYVTLEPWNKNKKFADTFFAFEWDLIDSLPTVYRLAIVIAKSLVQAYDRAKGDRIHTKMLITSYTIKTALFYIIAFNAGDVSMDTIDIKEKFMKALKMTGGRCGEKLTFSRENAKWITDADLSEHGDEARVWASKIFSFIKCLGEEGNTLTSYWNRNGPVLYKIERETLYINEICDCALKKLDELKISMPENGIPIKKARIA